MLNFFNFQNGKNGFLITNDLGEYCRLTFEDFSDFVSNKKLNNCDKEAELIKKGFIINEDIESFVESRIHDLRLMKSYIFKSPTLHIFVVTTECNGDCIYCQAHSSATKHSMMMSKEIAEKSVDIALSSPQNFLSFEFQGGEPLINFEVIRHIIEYTNANKGDKFIDFCLVSNLTLLTDEMIDFFKSNDVNISTSLDGDQVLHDLNRPMKDGTLKMYDKTAQKITDLRDLGIHVGAIQTTTRFSLEQPQDIIDEYVSRDFHSIFIRPLTPLGMAHDKWNKIGYTSDEFNAFYRSIIERLLKINKSGYFISEGHASIFLRKILCHDAVNYMELRSPCGGGMGQIAYYPNGDVYTCDEGRMLAEMGNESFKMGNVYDDDYNSLINSPACRVVCKSSVLEALPSCSHCVYQPYCGVCPVINYAFNSDMYEKHPLEYRCKIYKGMLDIIFDLIENKENEEVFWKWIN